MALYSELPVYRDSYRLLMEIYRVTNTFSREYKFSLGQDMRRDTLSLFRNLYRANKNKDRQLVLMVWSSSEYDNNNAWIVRASDGNVNNNNKNNNNYVRCVLAFGIR